MNIPGFADLQVNGYKGIDFSSTDLTEETFIFACKELIQKGTVVFLPTLITSSVQTYQRNLGLIARCMDSEDLKNHLPGIHLEGPFISAEEGARGAHQPAWIRKPDLKLLDNLMEWADGKVKLLTIAAEIPGADELCRYAGNADITVSLGHHLASGDDLDKLAKAGARALTHLGNGMPAMVHRHNNPLWAGIACDALTAMVIADGHHLPASVLKTVIRTKKAANVIVVSDASPIAGLPPGRYQTLGNDVILEPSGLLYNPHTGYLVGSSASMIDCMNHLLSLDIVPKQELYDMSFYNPLRLIQEDPSEVIKRLPQIIKTDHKTGFFQTIS